MAWRTRFKILELRDLRYVFGASLASNLGDGIVQIALAWAVLDLTHSPTDLGIVVACRVVAQVIVLLLGGVIADRSSRRAVMMAADLVRFCGQAAIGALLLTHHATVFELAASQVLLGAGSAFFQPASAGLLPAVAGEHLQEANALQGIAQAGSSIVGPVIGGILVVAVGGAWGLLADSVSYALSALLLLQITRGMGVAVAAEGGRSSMLADLRSGFREVASRTWVWGLIGALAVSNSLTSSWEVFGPLAARHWYGGAGAFALWNVMSAAGSLLSGLLLLRIKPRRPLLAGVLICMWAPVSGILMALRGPLAGIAALELISGLGPTAFNTLWWTALQTHVPKQSISRVVSYDYAGSYALMPLGQALAGPLVGLIGLRDAMLCCGLVAIAVMMATLSIRDVRELRSRTPEVDIVSA